VILTSVDGVIENSTRIKPGCCHRSNTDASIESWRRDDERHGRWRNDNRKIRRAKIVVRSGIPMVIASGRKTDVLARVTAGEKEGTLLFHSRRVCKGASAGSLFPLSQGALIVDDGAKRALREHGKSLFAAGASTVAKASLPPVMSCGFVIWTEPSSARGALARLASAPSGLVRSTAAQGRIGHRAIWSFYNEKEISHRRTACGHGQTPFADGCRGIASKDHQSLRRHAIEEVYELIDAIEATTIRNG